MDKDTVEMAMMTIEGMVEDFTPEEMKELLLLVGSYTMVRQSAFFVSCVDRVKSKRS